jgi:hypothetical protein
MQIYNQYMNREFNKAISFTLNQLRMNSYNDFMKLVKDEESFSKFRTVG